MDRTRPANTFPMRSPAPQDSLTTLVGLPDDVVPNIFSRLPASELFVLSSVSQGFLHCSAPLLRGWAERELQAALKGGAVRRWSRLLDVLANGQRHIAPKDWHTFLQATNTSDNGGAALIRMALFSLGVRGSDANFGWTDEPMPSRLDTQAENELKDLVKGAHEASWMANAAVAIIAGGMIQQLHQERLHYEGNSDAPLLNVTPAWHQLLEFFNDLSLEDQMRVLSQATPSITDHPCVGIEFRAACSVHLDAMRSQGRTKPPVATVGATRAKGYFRMLSWAGASGHFESCVANLFHAWFESGMPIGPWREQTPELRDCLFYIAAQAPESGKINDSFGKALVQYGFLLPAEWTDFGNQLSNHSLPRPTAVQEWIHANSAREAPGSDGTSC